MNVAPPLVIADPLVAVKPPPSAPMTAPPPSTKGSMSFGISAPRIRPKPLSVTSGFSMQSSVLTSDHF